MSASGFGYGPLIYRREGRIIPSNVNLGRFDDDPAIAEGNSYAAVGDAVDMASRLLSSPAWEDRVRASAILHMAQRGVTLPDAFPCIVEDDDSPRFTADNFKAPAANHRVWAAHHRREVLEQALPDLQATFDRYTEKWGPGSRRLFVLELVDNVPPNWVYTADSTADDIVTHIAGLIGIKRHLPARLGGQA